MALAKENCFSIRGGGEENNSFIRKSFEEAKEKKFLFTRFALKGCVLDMFPIAGRRCRPIGYRRNAWQ
jgi:hypothetical protein